MHGQRRNGHARMVGRLGRSNPLDSSRGCRFDIFSFGFKGPEDEAGILKSRDEVNKLIEEEVAEGLPAERIVLGGFSQGGSMTLVTGLTTPRRLAGLTVLSGWFAIREKVKTVCMGNLAPVTEKFDMLLVASRVACNRCSHLLGTR